MIRCEVSLDGGMSWMLANIHREEEPTIYNKYWCWVLWAVEVPMVELVKSDEVRCRAVDCSNNMQPKECVFLDHYCCLCVLVCFASSLLLVSANSPDIRRRVCVADMLATPEQYKPMEISP